jgi:hypothetical protein
VTRRYYGVLLIVFLTVSLVAGTVSARSSWQNGLTFETSDEDFKLNFGALIQPRFEYQSRESDNTQHTSFSVQRLRTNLQGYAYTPHLKYRVLVEYAQNPTLLEGWVQYGRFDPLKIRMGQMTVPFNRERDIPVSKLLSTERSITNGEFNWPTGRDAGIMLAQERIAGLEYRVGVFGGQTRRSAESNSNGVMASGRATYEILGNYERSESFYQSVENPNLTVGAGLLYAHKNTARNWFNSVGVSSVSDTANVSAATVDLQYRQGAWNTAVSYFDRTLDHYPGNQPDVDGEGFTVQAGYIVVPNTLYLNVRHAQADPSTSQRQLDERSNALGLHLFQKQNKSQVRFEVGQREIHDGTRWDEDEFVRIQQQLAF